MNRARAAPVRRRLADRQSSASRHRGHLCLCPDWEPYNDVCGRRRGFPLSLALISVDLWRRWDEVSGSGRRRTKALAGRSVVRSGLLSVKTSDQPNNRETADRNVCVLQRTAVGFVRGLITWTTIYQLPVDSRNYRQILQMMDWVWRRKSKKVSAPQSSHALCGAVTWSWAWEYTLSPVHTVREHGPWTR